jgi:RNA recognition motif-containing protein
MQQWNLMSCPQIGNFRKPKGFGFVTFVLPENAAAAFSKLTGTSFQGRLLHLLPGDCYGTMTLSSSNYDQ